MNFSVTVILLTYGGSHARRQYALRTLDSLQNNLIYDKDLYLVIADDGSPDAHLDSLSQSAQNSLVWKAIYLTNAQRGGYGKSYNLATQIAHQQSEVIMPIEDDWELLKPIALDPLVSALQFSNGVIRCIRLGYIGYTQALRGQFVSVQGNQYLLFDPLSPEPHVFAGHPRIETARYEREVGPWPEGLRAGETEFAVSKRDAARRGVVWPIDLVRPSGDFFAHIGSVPSDEPIYQEADV